MTHPARNTVPASQQAVPVRTCAGCGKRAPRPELIRIVATREGIPSVDPRAVRPGRGAWIHPDPSCIDRARARRSLVRALRLQELPPEALWAALDEVVSSRASQTSALE